MRWGSLEVWYGGMGMGLEAGGLDPDSHSHSTTHIRASVSAKPRFSVLEATSEGSRKDYISAE